MVDVDPADVRRAGAALDPATFGRVIEAARAYHDLGQHGFGEPIG
ncbi:hypothetical protein [Nocardioides terrae]|nr:hypothetical protein [Nocardioides terrae]